MVKGQSMLRAASVVLCRPFGELVSVPAAAAEFAQDTQVLERALALGGTLNG